MPHGNASSVYQDTLIQHQVDLVKLEEGARRQVLELLRELEADLIKTLSQADPTAPALTKFQQRRLESLLKDTRALTGGAFAKARRVSQAELLKLAQLETALAAGAFDVAVGTSLGVPTLNRQQLQAIVAGGLIQGAPSAEWWAKQAASTQAAFAQQMRLGVLAGESVGQLANRVKTLMAVPKHQAEAMVRTSVQSVSNLTRLRTYQESAHLVKAIKWLSTLDSKTTDICKGLDGLMWDPETFEPIGHSTSFPGPTAHWNCRSTQVPITRSFEELAAIKTPKAKATAKKLDAAGAGTRSALDGQVPASITYEQWLLLKEEAQPGFALESGALTPSKYSLWKQGKLNFKDLIDQSANPITVEQLQKQLEGIIPTTALPQQALAAQEAVVTESGAFGSKTAQAKATEKTAAEAMQARVAAAQEAAEVNAKKNARETIDSYADKATAPSAHHAYVYQQQSKKLGAAFTEQRKSDPVALLNDLDQRAAKRKLSVDLAHYKQSVTKGKKPSVSAQAAFDSLPEEAQKDVLDSIKLKQAELAAQEAAEKAAAERTAAIAAANEQAAQDIANIIANPAGQTKLAKALDDIQKDPVLKTLSPSKQLAQAKETAAAVQAQAEKSAVLSGYKKKLLSGEQPTPKQSQVVAGLTKDELDAVAAQIETLEDNLAGYKQAIIAGISPTKAQQKAANFLTPKGKKALQAELDAAKAVAPPTAAEVKVTAATQAAPVQEALVPELLDINAKGWKKVGAKPGGSVPGAIYEDAAGTRWIVKEVASDEVAKNEVLASRLYQLAGVDTADVRLILGPEGQLWVASKEVAIKKVTGSAAQKAKKLRELDGTYEGFAADSWLADWDTVGQTYDNLVIGPSGRALRVDVGGSLQFRAQGGVKGAAFGNKVDELQSLRDQTINPESHNVFKAIPEAKIEAGVAQIVRVTDAQIDELVDELGPANLKDRKALAAKLKARRDDLKKRYPNVVAPKSKPTPDAAARSTAEEAELVKGGRANGFAIRTDYDQIEDMQVTVMEYKDEAGKLRTRAVLKVRPEKGRQFQRAQLGNTGSILSPVQPTGLDSKIKEAARGIGALARDGKQIRVTDVTRVQKINEEYNAVRKEIQEYIKRGQMAQTQLKKYDDFYQDWIVDLNNSVQPGAGAAATWQPHTTALFKGGFKTTKPKKLAVAKADEQPFEWTRKTDRWNYQGANFSDSNVRMSKTQTHEMKGNIGNRFEGTNANGTKVTYFDYGSGNSFSAEGWTMLDVDGTGKKAIDKLFAALDDMGVNTRRASELDLEELYLDRMAYGRSIQDVSKWNDFQKFKGIANQQDRIAAKLKWFRDTYGVDVAGSNAYRETKNGIHQAFQGGRFHQMRADYSKLEIDNFNKTYIMYHNPTGLDAFPTTARILPRLKLMVNSGGQLRSLTERMRLGITPGTTSAARDMNDGGGSYVFLRVQKKSRAFDHVGIFWKPRVARRADAISYSTDQFGETREALQRADRAATLKQVGAHSARSNNETIFKDGLSFYDDLSHIVFRDKAEWEEALRFFRSKGFATWSDGRKLEDVLTYKGRRITLPPDN